MRRRAGTWRWPFAVVLLLAASCTSPADDGDQETSSTTTVATSTSAADVEGGGDPVDPADGPVAGGTLVYGLEADSADPWAPYRVSCGVSCRMVLGAVADPLVALAADGSIVPVLAESVDVSDDLRSWTISLRRGVRFHDGTELDAAAVAFNLESCRASALTGPTFAGIVDIEARGRVVEITTALPWASFAHTLADSACGFVFSPDWLASLADLPQRSPTSPFHDAAVAASPADGDPAAPVGTGPFVFESYTPGAGNSFRAVRNDDYWRGPAGVTGEALPYLDEIEFVVNAPAVGRVDGVAAGVFDVVHVHDGHQIDRLVVLDDVATIVASDFAATEHVQLNVASGTNRTIAAITGAEVAPEMDPDGVQFDNPLVLRSCRRALAHAIDRELLASEAGDAVSAANGPFPPGSPGYLDDTGIAAFDPVAARESFETCLVEWGTDDIGFRLQAVAAPEAIARAERLVQMWDVVLGARLRVDVVPVDAETVVPRAVLGDFQARLTPGTGAADLDGRITEWFAGAASPIGSPALNFGRIQDDSIDAALLAQRATTDPAARRQTAEAVNRFFGDEAWVLWLTWTPWAISSRPVVQDTTVAAAPDGTELWPVVGGVHGTAQIWCSDRHCD